MTFPAAPCCLSGATFSLTQQPPQRKEKKAKGQGKRHPSPEAQPSDRQRYLYSRVHGLTEPFGVVSRFAHFSGLVAALMPVLYSQDYLGGAGR